MRYSANHVFDYIELTDEFSIYEIPPLSEWVGRSLKELMLRNVYHISILAIKRPDGRMNMMPGAEYAIRGDDHLMVIGTKGDINGILEKMK